jgi:hypothetical protein
VARWHSGLALYSKTNKPFHDFVKRLFFGSPIEIAGPASAAWQRVTDRNRFVSACESREKPVLFKLGNSGRVFR